MATTQAQRASLFNTLAEMMGREEAETLVEQLPPSGWDTMATKDDVRVLGNTITAALAEGLANAAKERAEIVKSQARSLYVTVSTVVLAAISIWIALLANPGA